MDSTRKQAPHSRNASATTIPPPTPNPENRPSKRPSPEPQSTISKPEIHYTVFIRLPFPRSDFEDPPQVEWDSAKDKALWKIISKASSSKDLDWDEIRARFNVSLNFLLQQAAWLYERHFESMRAQMKRLGAGAGAASGTASPAPEARQGDSSGIGGVSMSRTGSRDSKVPPAITTQKATALPAGDVGSSPGTPRSAKPVISRTPSTATVTQSRVFSTSPKPPQRVLRGSSGSQRRPPPPARNISQNDDDESAVGHDGASESESEDDPPTMGRSQAFRRPIYSKKPTMGTLSSDGDAEDDDEDSGGYLPFATASKSIKEDPAATIRNSPKRQNVQPQTTTANKGKTKEPLPPPTDSSASSASSAQPPSTTSERPGPLSPRYRAELEKLSPRYKKSGSEGSPSMGSSFSDLDDASVTQSALEDALMSNMQAGSIGMGSRMSSMRDAALGRKH